MPGKVNPVIAESLLMVCAQVIGHDSIIAWCAAAGNFELNVMMPLMAWNLLDSIELLAAGTRNFETRLVRGLEAKRERAAVFVEQSLAMATALAPIIGYEPAAALAKESGAGGVPPGLRSARASVSSRRRQLPYHHQVYAQDRWGTGM